MLNHKGFGQGAWAPTSDVKRGQEARGNGKGRGEDRKVTWRKKRGGTWVLYVMVKAKNQSARLGQH